MPETTTRRGLLLALGTGALLSGCIVVPAGRPVYRDPPPPSGPPPSNPPDDDRDVVTAAPPAPQVEVIVSPPGPGFFWIAGYWAWVGGRHVWVGGRWEAHRPGWFWVPWAWVPHRRGWRAAPGHWQRG
jgi:hypothetical protein